ncbi:MAG: hypothetical protein M1298_00520, partial [Chloroflexi bacterium]|nr:hypothetical protein [Chloroflexota bacterium]
MAKTCVSGGSNHHGNTNALAHFLARSRWVVSSSAMSSGLGERNHASHSDARGYAGDECPALEGPL